MDKVHVKKIIAALTELYPEARAELRFRNPFETLVSTILSAQCTDKRVNQVTESLFRDYPDAQHMITLSQEALEEKIKSCGLYHSKAKHILSACRALVEEYGGQVPHTREALMRLPGVGQKTAGVVLLAAFGEAQIPVDTHVFRVSHRIGLSDAPTPSKTELQLRDWIEPEEWSHAHHLLIWLGRRLCHARKPDCAACPLNAALCAHRIVDAKSAE